MQIFALFYGEIWISNNLTWFKNVGITTFTISVLIIAFSLLKLFTFQIHSEITLIHHVRETTFPQNEKTFIDPDKRLISAPCMIEY